MRRFLYQPPMIWYAITLHWLYGGGLILAPRSQTLAILGGFQQFIDPLGTTGTGILLITVATIAAIGLLIDGFFGIMSRLLLLTSLLPQYMILLFALVTGLYKIAFGLEVFSQTQGTNIKVDDALVIIGLGPICLAALWHSVAIIIRIAYESPERQINNLRTIIIGLQRENKELREMHGSRG